MRASRGRTLLLWSFLLVVTPTTLLVFSLSFGVDGYRDWGDRYDADLTHKYLFARHPTSGFVTPLWRDDIVAGTTWLPTLHVAPIALEVQAARLFALSPFAIEFIAELVLILTAALGMTGFARAALGVSLEAAVAVGALHAAAIYTVYQNQNIPEFAMPGAVFPGILAVTHLLHRTLEARRTAAAVLASAGLALLTVAGAVHSSPAVFPPLLPLTLLYACFVFRRAQMAMAVAGGLAVAMIAYSPFASILLDTALVSRRMLAATGGGAGGVAEAVERLHGLLSQAISGPNSWGIDFVVLVGAWAWLVCGPRWRGAEVARRALLFGFVLTGTLWIAYMCPGVVNDLKGRVALLRNYSANRLPVFALFGVSAATGWIIERWLTGMPGSEIATKRRWIFRGGLFLAGGVIILQIRRVGTSLPSIPATALDHRLVMLLLLTVFMLASLALLVLLWRVCATPASPAMQLNAVLLIVLSTTSLATVAGGIQAFAIPSGRWESAEAATPMTFRQRYLVRPEYEFIRRHGAAEGRVVDLRFPAVASPRMFLGGSELTSLSLAGLRSADAYATLSPVVFGRLVVEVV
ncbi:MAG TPA: hypothetical protein VGQ77_03340, partial [Methylomirabilota bacterium]|nr:hypothetical protein [Methylomirabilota bacterium]